MRQSHGRRRSQAMAVGDPKPWSSAMPMPSRSVGDADAKSCRRPKPRLERLTRRRRPRCPALLTRAASRQPLLRRGDGKRHAARGAHRRRGGPWRAAVCRRLAQWVRIGAGARKWDSGKLVPRLRSKEAWQGTVMKGSAGVKAVLGGVWHYTQRRCNGWKVNVLRWSLRAHQSHGSSIKAKAILIIGTLSLLWHVGYYNMVL